MKLLKLLSALTLTLLTGGSLYFDFSPVTGKGLHTDLPSYQVQWAKLKNFLFRRGHLVSRPVGVALVGPLSTVEASMPRVITTVLNPRSSTTGGKTEWLKQTYRPTGTEPCTLAFTAVGAPTLHEALDDNPPDDGATLARLVIAASGTGTGNFYLTRGDITPMDVIDHVVVRARVRFSSAANTRTARVRLGLASCDSVEQVSRVFDIPGGNFAWHDLHAVLPSADALQNVITGFGDGDSAYAGGGPWTTAILNTVLITDRPQLFMRTDFLAGGTAAGNFEVDYIAMDVVGWETDSPGASGIIGANRIFINSHGFERYDNDVLTSVAGSVVLPTGENFDHAQLYGQLYVVNGVDQTYRYPNSSNVFEQFSGRPTGRTIAVFANRILLGWTTDGTTIVPERVIHSAINDGQDYTSPTAGHFDVLITPGGIVKLAPLSDDVCALYKEVGVYTLRRTGDDIIPMVPDPVDMQTGCLAMRSVQTTIGPTGTPIQFFLGRNPVDGISVFRFDGSTVVNVGQGLATFLRNDANLDLIQYSFAAIDPDSGTYWLWVPEGAVRYPTKAWLMDVRTNEWTEATFTHRYSAAGVWPLRTSPSPQPSGTPTFIWGRVEDGFLYKVSSTVGGDDDDSDGTVKEFNISSVQNPVLETGDLRLTEPQLQVLPYSIHIMYHDRGEVKCTVDVSTDGGKTFNTALSKKLGTTAADNSILYAVLDDTVAQGRRIRFRLTFSAWEGTTRSRVDIVEAWIKFETGGDDA